MAQVRQYRREEHREPALELPHSFRSLSFAPKIVDGIPQGLSKGEVEAYAGGEFHLVYAIMTAWESQGVLRHRRGIDPPVIGGCFSGEIIGSWRQPEKHVERRRRAVVRDTIDEWFQWPKVRLEETESATPPIPACLEHRTWRPPQD